MRTFASGACIVLGVVLLVLWGLSTLAVSAVKDSSTIEAVTEKALENSLVADRVSDTLQTLVIRGLEDKGIEVAELGLTNSVREIVDAAVRTQDFREAVAALVGDAHESITAELTVKNRESAPLTVRINLSAALVEQLSDSATLGSMVEGLALPPVEIELLSSEAFGKARTAYKSVDLAATWFGIAGLVLLVLGFIVSARKRWFVPKIALAIAVIALVVWFTLNALDADAIAEGVPGGADGRWGSLLSDILTNATLTRISATLLWVGLGAAALALVSGLWARSRGRRA